MKQLSSREAKEEGELPPTRLFDNPRGETISVQKISTWLSNIQTGDHHSTIAVPQGRYFKIISSGILLIMSNNI